MSTDLIRALTHYTDARGGEGPFVTEIPGVTVLRASHPKPPMPLIHKPALCVVAQGAKQGTFGESHLTYEAGQALVVGIETPTCGWVSRATPDEPFLGIVVEFDFAVMSETLEVARSAVRTPGESSVFVATVDERVAGCVVRLVELLDRPEAIAAVAPLIARELGYWLLTGSDGERIASLVLDRARATGIVAAIHALRARFAEPIRIDELAAAARMSASTFHRRFKTVTSMTPLQYQKQLRLLEARHAMLADGANAETAAFRAGYESQSHFSREYARMFGAPPRRDIETLRARAARA